MECNKDEALRAKQIAENKMTTNDFEGARKFALKAKKLFPDLDNISQILTVCDVHCSSQRKINGTQMDLYGILQVETSTDEATIKKQYRKLALALHPDKNKFPGAESAFKFICEANMILSDKGKRSLHDFKCKDFARPASLNPQTHHSSQNFSQKSKPDANGKSTFWTYCQHCKVKYEHSQDLVNKQILCQKCVKYFTAYDIGAQRAPEPARPAANGSNLGPDTVRSAFKKSSKKSRASHDEQNPAKKQKVSGSEVSKEKIDEEKSKSNGQPKSKDKEKSKSNGQPKSKDEEKGKSNDQSKSKDDLDVDAVYIDCKDPEFTNFDKEKEKDCFDVDQIWACYDPIDGMPRFYAQIRKIYKSGFKLKITWLEANPENEPEIKWAEEGLPVSCGKFVRGETEETRDRLMFSHRMEYAKGKARFSYTIYPKKGEIWALFKDWDMDWSSDAKSHMKYKFEIVEVLSDFDNESGVLVAYMVKVKGFVGLFKKISPAQPAERRVPSSELFRFSHRVPSVKLTGRERADVPVGSFELDTASLPDDLNELTEIPVFVCNYDSLVGPGGSKR